jgi:hypothetical protein
MSASFRPDTAMALREALVAVLPDLHRHCRDPWTLIGSAAARLAGVEVAVADLDVLTSVRDAQTLIGHWRGWRDETFLPPGEKHFRSCFARFLFPGLPVEIMGGLELFGERGWEPVRIDGTITLDMAGFGVPVPVVTEQIRVLESFGRPKDRRRAALLKSLCEEQL